jgi:hypothetical protein
LGLVAGLQGICKVALLQEEQQLLQLMRGRLLQPCYNQQHRQMEEQV